MRKSEVIWVDVSKGIVICLMVTGHTSIPEWLSNWIWSFHMPFFFIISALFTSWDKRPINSFIVRKAKILFAPFIPYSIINLAFLSPIMGYTYYEYATHILRTGWGGIALWFVPVFFISLLICRIVCRKYSLHVAAILLLLSVSISYFNTSLPWSMSVTPFAASMMIVIRRFQHVLRRLFANLQTIRKLAVYCISGAIVSFVLSQLYQLDMCSNHIIPIIPILIGIIGGCIMVIAVSIFMTMYFVRISKIIGSIGRNTYEIMALSQCIIMSINYYYPIPSMVKYLLMVIVLIAVVQLRHIIEGKFAKAEAI